MLSYSLILDLYVLFLSKLKQLLHDISMPYFFQFSIKGSTSDSEHLLKDNLQDTINFP